VTTHRPGLLVVGRGAGGDAGRAALAEFVRQAAGVPGVRDVFAAVGAVSLEAAEPTLTQSVRLFLEGGCGEVVVAPLLLPISPTVEEDLPGLLGQRVARHVRQRLVAQGQELLPPGLPVRLLASLDVESLVVEGVSRRVVAQGGVPAREGVVLCGEGSALYHERWEALMGRLTRALRGRGLGRVEHAYVGATVGRSPDAVVDAIGAVLQGGGLHLAHVVPVFLTPEPAHLRTIAAAVAVARSARPGRVAQVGGALLPDPVLATRFAHVVLAACGLFPGGGEEGLA